MASPDSRELRSSSMMASIPLSATKPSFQLPISWHLESAVKMVRYGEHMSTDDILQASLSGFTTPAALDVGGGSIRVKLDDFPKFQKIRESVPGGGSTLNDNVREGVIMRWRCGL